MTWLKKWFARPPQLLDWRQFTEHFARQAEQNHGARTRIEWGSSIEDSSVRIITAGGNQGVCYLGNHYQQYCRDPAQLAVIIGQAQHIIGQLDRPQQAPIIREAIFPMLKNRTYLETIRRMQADGGEAEAEPLLSRPLAGDLMLIYMLDCGQTMRALSAAELARAGIADEAALYQQSLDNLQQYAGDQVQLVRSRHHSLCQIMLDQTFDASLVLQAEQILARAGVALPGRIVTAVPARDTLLLCGSEDAAALNQMQTLIDEISHTSPYQISRRRFVLAHGQLSVLGAH